VDTAWRIVSEGLEEVIRNILVAKG
jgi:hypothetical protein